MTLSVSSGKQPNCLTDSSTLIEPIPEDESDENEDEAGESSSEEADSKSSSPRPKDSPEEPVSKKDSDSAASEKEVLPETEVPVATSATNDVIPTIVQSTSTDSDVSEYSVVETDREKRQSGAEALLSDSDDKAQTGAVETLNDNATNEINSPSPLLKADDEADNSDSEGVPVLDPRNLPSSDSENEQDPSYNSPLNTSNMKESSDVIKPEDSEIQTNEEPVPVVDSPNGSHGSIENIAVQETTESPVSIVVENEG